MLNRILEGTITAVDILKSLVLFATVAILVIVFVGLPILISGESMEPNFHSGEAVIVSRFAYLGGKEVKRGDVVAAKFPADSSKTRLIKRVIGLPGDTITRVEGGFLVNGVPFVEGVTVEEGDAPYEEVEQITLRTDEYYLAGDNRPGSSDSRLWGAVQRSDIQGKVSFVIYPVSRMRYVLNSVNP